jgi:hypothetical protein
MRIRTRRIIRDANSVSLHSAAWRDGEILSGNVAVDVGDWVSHSALAGDVAIALPVTLGF